MAMIHTEVSHDDVKRIPKAKQAVDDEWAKLMKLGVFGMTEFRILLQVKEDYAKVMSGQSS